MFTHVFIPDNIHLKYNKMIKIIVINYQYIIIVFKVNIDFVLSLQFKI